MPRPASGHYGNGAQPLDLIALAGAGLLVVRDFDEHGKVASETVIPTEDVPLSWLAPHELPRRKCGACGSNEWRRDRATGQGYVCARCFP